MAEADTDLPASDDVTSLIESLAPTEEAAPASEEAPAAEAAAVEPLAEPVAEPAEEVSPEPEPVEPPAAVAPKEEPAPAKVETPAAKESPTLAALLKQDKEYDDQIEAIEKQIESGEIDEITASGKVGLLVAKQNRLNKQIVQAREAETAQVQAYEKQWSDWGSKPENKDIGTDRGRKMLQEEFDKLAKKYPNADATALHVAALESWNGRLTSIRAQKKAAAPAPATRKPVVTPNGGKALPPVSPNRPPIPQAKTFEQQVKAFANTAGSPEALLA